MPRCFTFLHVMASSVKIARVLAVVYRRLEIEQCNTFLSTCAESGAFIQILDLVPTNLNKRAVSIGMKLLQVRPA